MNDTYQGFDEYAANATHQIPVFVLTPTPAHGEQVINGKLSAV